ncbi:hypothetical protein C8J55DRAFT_490131 [Lentinula edodes]|uniref:MAGE domain-containing protein n=1 Tax=Lentinula lateritia TaxID=40482 RepID=A0A9W9DLH3_9AGAR|nr:hypothetical protein C8J55DRAFT_490131 [Lentinula edodes]
MARGSSSTQTRSQKTNTVKYGGPSQGSSQTQPKRGTSAQRVDSEEKNGGNADADGAYDEEIDVEGGGGGASQEGVDINLKANQLVRLALFMKHKWMPLRRDEISRKACRTRAAMDKAAAAANPSALNEESEEDDGAPPATQGKRRGKATGLKKKASPTGSKTYILRSILHSTLISLAALPDEEILTAELDGASDELDDDGTPAPSQIQGSRRPRRSQSTKAAGGKRGRLSTVGGNLDGEDGENKYEWRWGPRAHSEIGEKAVQDRRVYGGYR